MKKKILASLLAVCLFVGMAVPAFATEEKLPADGETTPVENKGEENKVNLLDGDAPVAKPKIEIGDVQGTLKVEDKIITTNGGLVGNDSSFTTNGRASVEATLTKGADNYSNVLIKVAIEGTSDGIQIIAQDTDKNWIDIVETGEWGPKAGFPLSTADTTFYIVPNQPGTYTGTFTLVDVGSDGKGTTVLATATKEIVVADPSIANVGTKAELETALTNGDVDVINITKDIDFGSDQVLVSRDNVTINGGGFELKTSASGEPLKMNSALIVGDLDGGGYNGVTINNLKVKNTGSGKHVLQVFRSTATLNDVTLTHTTEKGYPLLINTSDVVITGKLTLSTEKQTAWGLVDVSIGADFTGDTTAHSKLTFADGSSVAVGGGLAKPLINVDAASEAALARCSVVDNTQSFDLEKSALAADKLSYTYKKVAQHKDPVPTPPAPPTNPSNNTGGGSSSGGTSNTSTGAGSNTDPVVTPPADGTSGTTDVSYGNVTTTETMIQGDKTISTAEITLDTTVTDAATTANPVSIKTELSTSDTVSAIENATTSAVEVKLVVPNAVLTNANVLLSEIKVDAAVFEAAKASGKDITFAVETADGAVVATWTFNGAQITNAVATDLAVNMYEAPASMVAAANSPIVLSFNHSGALPSRASVSLNVDGKYNNGDKLFLYYVNTSTGALDFVSANNTVANGKVTIAIDHCSEYILTKTAITTATPGTPATKPPQTGDTAPISAVVVLAVMAGALVLGKKKLFNN